MIAGPTRTISVKLFGPQAALAGADAVDVLTPETVNAQNLKRLLGETAPRLLASLPASRIAIDHAYAAPDDPVPAGTEVALIGLVSGG